jgi:enoyl-[acyl-carrier protein] reductase I
MAFLQGKKILITGLLSNRSIAYGIAQACQREGAELAFTYVGERFKDRITEFAAEFGSKLVFDCDVTSDEQITALFADLGQSWSAAGRPGARDRLRAARSHRRRISTA